jgi:hypothetical protein
VSLASASADWKRHAPNAGSTMAPCSARAPGFNRAQQQREGVCAARSNSTGSIAHAMRRHRCGFDSAATRSLDGLLGAEAEQHVRAARAACVRAMTSASATWSPAATSTVARAVQRAQVWARRQVERDSCQTCMPFVTSKPCAERTRLVGAEEHDGVGDVFDGREGADRLAAALGSRRATAPWCRGSPWPCVPEAPCFSRPSPRTRWMRSLSIGPG